MIGRASRFGGIGLAVCGVLALPGCKRGPAPDVAAVGAPFSLETPVEQIAADKRGKAVLDRDLPGLMTNSQYILFEDMSLAQIATISSGQLTKTRLDVVEADLSRISR